MISLALLLGTQVSLPSYDLGGVRAQVVLPQWTPDPVVDATFASDGWTYQFKSGSLVGRTRGTGAWADLPAVGAQGAEPPVVKWPMKIFVAANLDQVSKTEQGYWMPRRYIIAGEEIRAIRSEVALFCYMVKAHTKGRVAIEPDFEVDEEARILEPEEKAEDALMVSLRGRLITSKPYRSAFAITPELDFQPTKKAIGSVPTTFLPFFASYDISSHGRLAQTLFSAWTEQLQDVSAQEGYEIGSASTRLPEPSVGRHGTWVNHPADAITEPMWEDLADAATPNFDRNRSARNAEGQTWASVADNPWVKLPYLNSDRQSALGMTIKPGELGAEVGGQAFDFSKQGSMLSGKILVVQDRYAEIFGAKGLKPLGFVPVGGRVLVCFDAGSASGNDVAILGATLQPVTSTNEVKTAVPFDANEAERLASSGYLSIRTIVDNDRGAVGELRQFPRPRNGWVRLLGYGTTQAMFDSSKTPFLEFWLKTSAGQSALDLVLEGPSGQKRMRMFGRTPGLPGRKRVDPQDLSVTADGTWQKVIVDLRAGETGGPISSIYLAPPPAAAYWDPPNPMPSILLDDLKITETASGEVAALKAPTTVTAMAESTDPIARALWAANGEDPEKLRSLLDDRDYLVALNAIMRFGNRKDPAAIPSLIRIARSFTLRPSKLAYEALSVQDSDEAWTAITQSVSQGPFDINKREGVRQLIKKSKDPKLTGQISLLFVSPSWETRRVASIALSKLEGENRAAKIVSLSFINGTEPAIREAAMSVADVEVPEVRNRLRDFLDPITEQSDYLRAQAALKLILSKDKATRDLVWKSVPNLAPAAMEVFLDGLEANAENRAMVVALPVNRHFLSTNAAFRWLARAGGVTEADVSAINPPSDPRVYLQLLELRKDSKAAIPAAFIERMRASRDWRVLAHLGNQ